MEEEDDPGAGLLEEEQTRLAHKVLRDLAERARGEEKKVLLLATNLLWREHVRLLYGEHEEQP